MPVVPSMLVTNVCHVTNKVDELCGVIAVIAPSLILITESWLDTTIPDSAVRIRKKFTMYRRDRPTPDGGILAYVNTTIPTTRLFNLEAQDKEVIWLLLKPTRTPRPFSTILVAGVY